MGPRPPGFARNPKYLEPIGPATTTINPTEFQQDAAAALERANGALAAFDALLDMSNARDEIALRCSVEDLLEDNTQLHGDSMIRGELKSWHEERIFPTGYGVDLNEDGEGGDEDEDEDGDTSKLDAFNGIPDPTKSRNDAQVVKLLDEAKTSSLQILKPIKDMHLFLRKTKPHDYNTLTSCREAVPALSPLMDHTSDLSSLVYTITLHPIPRTSNRSTFPVRNQTLYLLGSTSLWELRENLRAGGEGMPDVAEDDEDEDDEDGWGGRPAKRPKWTEEKRETGCVWGVEGVLYPDESEDRVDYAEMVCSLLDSTMWAPKRAGRQESLDIEVNGSPSTESVDQKANDGDSFDSQPHWRAGESIQETMIGELDLKIGEPYWYMHQGNCEHVWTVDSIRYIHPDDPKPISTKSTAPYPITAFLSRGAEAKCKVCDRGTGSIVTLDDELAGVSPALLCATCFEMLHGDNADGHVVVVPTLLEP